MAESVPKPAALMPISSVAVMAGGSGGGGGGDVDVSDTEMEATIELAAWEADFDWESVIEGFNQTYPNITVQMTKTPFKDFFTRLQTQASGDNLPDAFMMNGPNFQLYASHGIIASFENAVEAGELDFAISGELSCSSLLDSERLELEEFWAVCAKPYLAGRRRPATAGDFANEKVFDGGDSKAQITATAAALAFF